MEYTVKEKYIFIEPENLNLILIVEARNPIVDKSLCKPLI